MSALATLAGARAWWGLAEHPPLVEGDVANHLVNALSFYWQLVLSEAPLLDLAGWRDTYPPLAYAATALVFLGTGPGLASACAGQAAWVAVMALATYRLVEPWGGRWGAACAAVPAATGPLVAEHLQTYLLDLPLAAMVVATVAAVEATEDFRRRDAALASGLLLGLALLTRWSALFYLGPYLAWKGLRTLARVRRDPTALTSDWVPAAALVAAPLLLAGAAWWIRALLPPTPLEAPWFPPSALVQVATPWLAACALAGWAMPALEGPWRGLTGWRFPAGAEPVFNYGRSLALAAALAGPFYLLNAPELGARLFAHLAAYPVGENLAGAALSNLEAFASRCLPGLPLWLAAGFFCSWRKGLLPAQAPLWWTLLGGTLVTALAMGPGPRYFLPSLPLALGLALGWLPRAGRAFRWLAGGVLALGLWQAGAGWLWNPGTLVSPLSGPWDAYTGSWNSPPALDPTSARVVADLRARLQGEGGVVVLPEPGQGVNEGCLLAAAMAEGWFVPLWRLILEKGVEPHAALVFGREALARVIAAGGGDPEGLFGWVELPLEGDPREGLRPPRPPLKSFELGALLLVYRSRQARRELVAAWQGVGKELPPRSRLYRYPRGITLERRLR